MTRIKKSRKPSGTAPKHAPRTSKSERVPSTKKRDTGNKSGSRQNPGNDKQGGSGQKSSKDPRHGSKKPVALELTPQTPTPAKAQKPKQPKLTDEQLLLKLEEDPRLNDLLDKLEEGRVLGADDQRWLDEQLSKIEALMDKLGISDLDDSQADVRDDDDALLDKFESGAELLKQYQDKD
ncbi:Der GTPase-activating protein YihI [Shewanella sp.]|uniref:Der GTPase-activating protein YihI n=1 Tax=Shewanella sp. TaxID=50422 RepID=UPI0035627777